VKPRRGRWIVVGALSGKTYSGRPTRALISIGGPAWCRRRNGWWYPVATGRLLWNTAPKGAMAVKAVRR